VVSNVVKEILNRLKVCRDGALPLISAICDKIQLAKRIDFKIGSDQDNRIVSTGTAIKAMVMNIVTDRKALYKLDEFYAYTDTEKLFNEGINSYNFTDDVMARALDELYDIGPKKVMTETAMFSIKEYKIPVKSIHADTTSKNLYGQYKDCEDEEFDGVKINRGYSKDHRPDLKQILFGLGATKDRIIVTGDLSNGNTSDKDWNKDILKELRSSMKNYGLSNFIYVADSAAVTKEMLKALHGSENEVVIPFVSRLPGTFSLEKKLRQKAIENKNKWEHIGQISKKEGNAEYKLQSFEDELYGRKYRFIVCHSSQLDERKRKTIEKGIAKEKEALNSAMAELNKINFYCEKDAYEALKKFETETKLKFHELGCSILQEEVIIKRKKPGRPKQDEKPNKEDIFKIKVNVYEDENKIKYIKDMEGMFVLITGILDEKYMDNRSILVEYKEQTSVETCFRVLKDPYFIDELFLKKPKRVEALAYVMLISLMVLTLLERTVRENLKGEKEKIVVSGKRKTFTPTGLSIIEAFEYVQVNLFFQNGQWYRQCDLSTNLKRILKLAGFSEDIYIESFKKID
jgi:transposase